MRRNVILVLVGLVLAGSDASAVGLDLNWDKCLDSVHSYVGNKDFYCQFADPNDPDADSLNAEVFHFVGSLRTGQAYTDVLGWDAVLSIDFEQNYGDAWWQLGAGGCRAGSITFKCNGFSTATTCNTQLMETSPPPVTTESWTSLSPGVYQYEYRIGATRTTETAMAATVKYQLFEVSIDSRFTKLDPNDPRAITCAPVVSARHASC